MKLARSIAGCGLAMGLVLAWGPMARADEETCARALSKAYEKYFIASARAKGAEALSKLPGGKPVTEQDTLEALARARLKADVRIQKGCAGVAKPSDVDPLLCPLAAGATAFADCLDDYVESTDAFVDLIQEEDFPDGPICIDDPICNVTTLPGITTLPVCDPQKGCFCHATAEGGAECVNFSGPCETAQPCNSSSECPQDPNQPPYSCYVNSCCGASGVCGRSQCEAGGSGGAGEGLRSSASR